MVFKICKILCDVKECSLYIIVLVTSDQSAWQTSSVYNFDPNSIHKHKISFDVLTIDSFYTGRCKTIDV